MSGQALFVQRLERSKMFLKSSLYLVFTVFVLCESGFVENLGKCNINDGKCERDLIQSLIPVLCKDGIEELGIPKLDPFKLSNVSVSVLDAFDITLVEGTAKGIKNCIIDRFNTNIKKEHATMELTCDISIKGHYKVDTYSPIIKNLFGGQAVRGDGNGKVKIDKLHMKYDFYFYVEEQDGELYIKCKADKIFHTYDIGKMSFFADNLYLGNQESSKLVISLLNQNWRMLMDAFGKNFMDKAMTYVYDNLHKFTDVVPAKNYIIDDLTPYISNKKY